MKLLRDLILLGPLPKPVRSEGGIHLVEHYQDDEKQWRVLAVGPKVKPEIQVGTRVLVDIGTLGVEHTFEDGRRIVRDHKVQMLW